MTALIKVTQLFVAEPGLEPWSLDFRASAFNVSDAQLFLRQQALCWPTRMLESDVSRLEGRWESILPSKSSALNPGYEMI